MTGKIPSAITEIRLNKATFSDVPVEQLTFVNFFYGSNSRASWAAAVRLHSSSAENRCSSRCFFSSVFF